MLLAAGSLLALINAQSALDPTVSRAVPLTCANTVTKLLLQNPDWAKMPDVPGADSYRISFETVMTVEID